MAGEAMITQKWIVDEVYLELELWKNWVVVRDCLLPDVGNKLKIWKSIEATVSSKLVECKMSCVISYIQSKEGVLYLQWSGIIWQYYFEIENGYTTTCRYNLTK